MGPLPPRVGLVVGSVTAPEHFVPLARRAEQLGFGEIWLSEHYFYSGGLAGAAAGLAATERVPVGLGVVSALVRHPAVLAMELATLSRLYPGRIQAGVGLGESPALDEMGLDRRGPLDRVRNCLQQIRQLLDGEAVGGIRLGFPPAKERVPLYVGASGPRMLKLSGEVADGTLLSWVKSHRYVRWARRQIAAGVEQSGRRDDPRHRVVSLALFSVDRDARAARQSLREPLIRKLARRPTTFTDVDGTSEELATLLARGGANALERALPERWLDDLTVSGNPEQCAAAIRRHLEAGADCVALFPMPSERAEELVELAAAELLPRLVRAERKGRQRLPQ